MSEWIDIVDQNGEPTGETVEREEAHRCGIRHRTAHVWLVREKDGCVQILLQKRAACKDSFPGCYDISSAGHIPAGVEYKPSAIRELKEELGVDAKEEELLFCGDRAVAYDACFGGKPFYDRQYTRVFMMWFDQPQETFCVQKEEVEHVRWMDLDECLRGVENNSFAHCIEPVELRMLKKALACGGMLIE